ncbi:HPr family phosphocarrier protein [Lachnospiraceae bacterium OttesenSCG-928-D06]|nr:HPr family phosphocarrier protein [Lachnospiraceae bacterium OttesenSCG-928-D06]
MKTFNYCIKDEVGLHARPAGLLVKAVGTCASTITLSCNGKSADAKRLLAIMGLGAKCGDEVTVTVEGADEEAACEKIETFMKENL